MRAVIIGNGTVLDYELIRSMIKEDDFVICADGGYNHAKKTGIVPDLVIGDFDSSVKPENDIAKFVYPVRKDFTDGELCVKYACEHGFEEIVMLGMTGNRMDHTLTDMLLLAQCKKGCIIDDNNEIYLLRDKFVIENKKGMTLSIIPVNGDLCGLYARGLEYPLNGDTLYFGESRGNSNIITEDYCEITARSGMGFIIINKGQ